MDNNNSTQDESDSKPRAAMDPSPSLPQWRSVQMMSPVPDQTSIGVTHTRSIPRPMSLAGPSSAVVTNTDVIDKEYFFSVASKPSTTTATTDDVNSNWVPTQLRPVPAFYPLERSSRFVEDDLPSVAARLSEANRVLSVQAIYNNDTATASLMTSENVEMHLSLWKTTGGPEKVEGIVVELQRRKGDSIPFHRYSRYILDAAVGDFDAQEHIEVHGTDMDMVYSKKVQRMLNMNIAREPASEQENAIIAIEIAHGLLMKDRMDARQLGLESLCLLTDPSKTGNMTAVITSHVVLLGTATGWGSEQDDNMMFDEAPFQEIRETILSLIQLRRIGEVDDFEQEAQSEEEEHITILHNLALAVLANALDVIESEEQHQLNPEETNSALSSTSSIYDSFLTDASECTDREIMKTLITELGKAQDKPHNATLSAKCIGSLCRASREARKRAKELGAKTVVQTALDVGTRTHLKLETECEKLTKTLTLQAPTEEENH
jgi:hypothetical protein